VVVVLLVGLPRTCEATQGEPTLSLGLLLLQLLLLSSFRLEVVREEEVGEEEEGLVVMQWRWSRRS